MHAEAAAFAHTAHSFPDIPSLPHVEDAHRTLYAVAVPGTRAVSAAIVDQPGTSVAKTAPIAKLDRLGGTVMPYRRSIGTVIVAIIVAIMAAFATFAIGMTMTNARVFDESRYPDWTGQWMRLPVTGIRGNPSWDPNKSEGLAQAAPLT